MEMSEGIAKALNIRLEEFNEAMGKLESVGLTTSTSMDLLTQTLRDMIIRSVSEKYIYYLEHYTKATFVTRWYYKAQCDRWLLKMNLTMEAIYKN